MTLLDAPGYDVAGARRRRIAQWSGAGALALLVVALWVISGRPVDWPWNWMEHLRGRSAVNRFFADLEKNDLRAAYAVWTDDQAWQQHPEKFSSYPFAQFQKDWAADGRQNEYGAIRSHRIAAARMIGNVLRTGTFVNGRRSQAVNLDYDPREHTLSFSPEDSRFYEGPGGIS